MTCARLVAILLAAVVAACAAPPPRAAWEARLHGDAVILLGEVHDNAEQHRDRLAVLRRAFAAGWRPAIAMEQFDREHQADIDRARRERPGDAQHVIDAAAAPNGGGWHWAFYRPYVALALEYGVPLIAADLSNADAAKVVRGGSAAVFDPQAIAALDLERPIAPAWEAAQEREIDAGHCHALPPSLWPQMARAQFARDAVIAHALVAHAAHGVVLLAGNGHVRRDIGVPRWLGAIEPDRVLSVGYLEDDDTTTPVDAFDVVVRTAAAARGDPCAGFRLPQPR